MVFESLRPDIDSSDFEGRGNWPQGVSCLNCLWIYVPGCEAPELFVGICSKCVGSLTCFNCVLQYISVYGWVYQGVSV